jgi:hypothetical protein
MKNINNNKFYYLRFLSFNKVPILEQINNPNAREHKQIFLNQQSSPGTHDILVPNYYKTKIIKDVYLSI